MKESFYEESSSPSYSKFLSIVIKIPMILFWITLIFTIFYFFTFFVINELSSYIFLAFQILFMVYLRFLYGRTNISYDYTFVSGSIRFNKVIHNKKRKHICHFEYTDVIKVGKVGSDSFDVLLSKYKGKINYLCANKNLDKDYFYVYASGLDKNTLFVLECSEEFIRNIVVYAGRNILEKEYLQ